MARKYESAHEYDMRVIREEARRHEKAYYDAQDRYAYSLSNSVEKTMRKHEILWHTLVEYQYSADRLVVCKAKLHDIEEHVNRNLKRLDAEGGGVDIRTVLELIKTICDREG